MESTKPQAGKIKDRTVGVEASRSSTAERICEARWLGLVPYEKGLSLQEDLVARRTAGEIPDQLLFLEHPHVVTMGRAARFEHLGDSALLAQKGVQVFETGRGGDVTYHGPGQLVAYPILDLTPDRCDLHRYVRDLEQVMIRLLQDFGITGHVSPGRTGVWVQDTQDREAKIGAIGVRVARWVTSHGIAFNVRTDLRYFDLIVPCGLAGSRVISLGELIQDVPTVGQVARRFSAHFADVFGRQMQVHGLEARSGSA